MSAAETTMVYNQRITYHLRGVMKSSVQEDQPGGLMPSSAAHYDAGGALIPPTMGSVKAHDANESAYWSSGSSGREDTSRGGCDFLFCGVGWARRSAIPCMTHADAPMARRACSSGARDLLLYEGGPVSQAGRLPARSVIC